jgi:hypothetical protein
MNEKVSSIKCSNFSTILPIVSVPGIDQSGKHVTFNHLRMRQICRPKLYNYRYRKNFSGDMVNCVHWRNLTFRNPKGPLINTGKLRTSGDDGRSVIIILVED